MEADSDQLTWNMIWAELTLCKNVYVRKVAPQHSRHFGWAACYQSTCHVLLIMQTSAKELQYMHHAIWPTSKCRKSSAVTSIKVARFGVISCANPIILNWLEQGTVATSPVVLRWLCDSPRTGCAWRTTPYVYVARTSNNRVIMACEFYCCLLPQCEALRMCRSGFPIATVRSL